MSAGPRGGAAAPRRKGRGSSLPSPSVGAMRPPRPGEAVREAVRRDPLGAELRCSLFAAALQSYRRDSALRPFPSRYGGADAASKDFEALVSGTRPRRRSGDGEG